MKHHKKEKLANRLQNRRPQIIPFIIAFCGVMIITACSSMPSEETIEVKRETIFVQPETISFNKEMNQIDLTLTTNLPPETVVGVTLNDPEGNYLGSDFDLAVNKEGQVKVEISPYDSMTNLINGEYLVDLTVSVNGDDEDETENINEDFLFDSKVGGFSDELEEQYADSKEVTVTLEDEYNSFNYELKVSSTKPILLENGYTAEQAAQLEKEQSESAAAIEEDTSTDSSLDSAGTYDSFQSELEYATGADWAEYTFDEKFIAVETILQAMESGGTTITADTYWFIDALNAYYGDGTDPGGTEKIVDMISLSGVTGGVIK